jgi:hypothetical protein
MKTASGFWPTRWSGKASLALLFVQPLLVFFRITTDSSEAGAVIAGTCLMGLFLSKSEVVASTEDTVAEGLDLERILNLFVLFIVLRSVFQVYYVYDAYFGTRHPLLFMALFEIISIVAFLLFSWTVTQPDKPRWLFMAACVLAYFVIMPLVTVGSNYALFLLGLNRWTANLAGIGVGYLFLMTATVYLFSRRAKIVAPATR